MTDDTAHKEIHSRWTDNPFRQPGLSPEQLEWLDKRDAATSKWQRARFAIQDAGENPDQYDDPATPAPEQLAAVVTEYREALKVLQDIGLFPKPGEEDDGEANSSGLTKEGAEPMTRIWMVSAERGTYTDTWVKGGYAAVGWLDKQDLTSVDSRAEIFRLYALAHPEDSPRRRGANAGQLAGFVLNVQPGDYVMTRCQDPTREYRYGIVENQRLYYAPDDPDLCPFPHRRKVQWFENNVVKENLSIPFQRSLSANRTLFEVKHREEFLVTIGERKPRPKPRHDTHQVVLDRILEKIDDKEFEELVSDLMKAMGYAEVQVVGGPHDGGVDVTGALESILVNVNVYVQAKHYQKNAKISKKAVQELHNAICGKGHGAIVTTADFNKQAHLAASEPGFPYHISLINGHRLVELLMEHWNSEQLAVSPDEDVPSWHERLGLAQGLVLS